MLKIVATYIALFWMLPKPSIESNIVSYLNCLWIAICQFMLSVLLNLYTGQQVRVLWNGIYNIFRKFLCIHGNGVKQGGILSPVLFCVYFDVLLLALRDAGVGCYIGPWLSELMRTTSCCWLLVTVRCVSYFLKDM